MRKKQRIRSLLLASALLLSAAFTGCSDEAPDEEMSAPEAQTSGASDATRTTVTVAGRYSGKLSKISEYGVKYSTSVNFPSDATTTVSFEGQPSTVVSATLSDLSPNTHYYYCWYASTKGGSTVTSAAGEFTTVSTSKPMFSELKCDSISENVMILRCGILEVGDAYVVERGVSYRVKSSSQSSSFTPVSTDSIDAATDEFIVVLRGLSAATTYEIRPYAKNSSDANGDTGMMEGYGDTQTFTTDNQTAPVLEIYDPSNVKTGSATVTGRITSMGSGTSIDEFGICYSTTNETPTWLDSTVKFQNKALNQIYSYEMTDLEEETTYYVCFYAKNTISGKEHYGYSDVVQFTTGSLQTPGLIITGTTSAATSIVCTANIYENYDESVLTEKGFIWSSSTAEVTLDEAKKSGCQMEAIESGKTFESTITGLKVSNSYYIRAYAIYKNTKSERIGYSDAYNVMTSSFISASLDEPVVSDITYTSALLQGKIASEGNGTITKRGFCISSQTYSPTVDNNEFILEANSSDFTATLSGLSQSTNYYVRAYVICELEDQTQTVYSSNTGFQVNTVEAASFNFLSLFSLSYNAISASVEIGSLGTGTLKEKGYIWKTTRDQNWSLSMDDCDAKMTVDDESMSSITISGLTPSTDYYIRAYAITETEGVEAIGYSEMSIGTTQSVQLADVSMSYEWTSTTISLTGTINSLGTGNLVEVGFKWIASSVSQDVYESGTVIKAQVNADNTFTATITGLTPETEYLATAYVTTETEGEQGTSYTNSYIINTPSLQGASFYGFNSSSTTTSITLTTGISNMGDGTLVEKGFLWKKVTDWDWVINFDHCDGSVKVTDGNNESFTTTITGMKPSTDYFVTAYAITEYEGNRIISYWGCLSMSTNSFDISSYSYEAESNQLTFYLSFNLDVDSYAEAGLSYGSDMTEEAEIGKVQLTKDTSGSGYYVATVTGLTDNTTYYFRGYILNADNTYSYTGWLSATTSILKGAPSIDDKNSPDKKD